MQCRFDMALEIAVSMTCSPYSEKVFESVAEATSLAVMYVKCLFSTTRSHTFSNTQLP